MMARTGLRNRAPNASTICRTATMSVAVWTMIGPINLNQDHVAGRVADGDVDAIRHLDDVRRNSVECARSFSRPA